jgi:hypothetical protein
LDACNGKTSLTNDTAKFLIGKIQLDFENFGHYPFETGLWIRIRIGSGLSDFVDPDPYWESGSGSRGKKMKKFQWKNALFSYFNKKILPLKRV